MKILQLCHKPPFPAYDGGAIAMNNITQGLLSLGHKVKVLTVETTKHPVSKELSADYKLLTDFDSVFVDTKIRKKDAFFNLFQKKSYNIQRFVNEELKEKLNNLLEEKSFDLVILEGLFVAPYFNCIREQHKGKIILRAHNVEHVIWERMARNSNNPFKAFYLRLLSHRMKEFELKTFHRVDGVCAMTDIDRRSIKKLSPQQKVASIPSGYIMHASDGIEEQKNIEENSIFHIASMDWQPNQEAVDWFLEEIWDLVSKENPQAKLHLAGRNMPNKYLETKTKNVHITGEVKSAKEFYKSKEIMIVPLLSGSGMRIKIVEGMALGKVIISTSIGAEGIECTHGENILIADDPKSFAAALNKVLKDKAYCKELSNNAQAFIGNRYDNKVICEQMMDFVEAL